MAINDQELEFDVRFRTTHDLRRREIAEAFLQILKAHNPVFVPTRLGTDDGEKIDVDKERETVIRAFLVGGLELSTPKSFGEYQLQWDWRMYGDTESRLRRLPWAGLSILENTVIANNALSDLASIADELYNLISPSFGQVGLRRDFHPILTSIPDIYWITYFGPIYLQIIDREKLLSAPCHEVKEMPDGGFKLILTEGYKDSITTEGVAKAQAVKEHLGKDFFWHSQDGEWGKPGVVQRVTPKFDLSKVPQQTIRLPANMTKEIRKAFHSQHRLDPNKFMLNIDCAIDDLRYRLGVNDTAMPINFKGLAQLDELLWEKWLESTSREYWQSNDLWQELTAYMGEIVRREFSGKWKLKALPRVWKPSDIETVIAGLRLWNGKTEPEIGKVPLVEFDYGGKRIEFDPLESVGWGLCVLGGKGALMKQLREDLKKRKIPIPDLEEKAYAESGRGESKSEPSEGIQPGFSEEALSLLKQVADGAVEQLTGYTEYGDEIPAEGKAFHPKKGDPYDTLRRLRSELQPLGYLAFLSDLHYGDNYKIDVLHTLNPYEILRVKQTNGWNYDISPDEIIQKLQDWERCFEFSIIGADRDWVQIELLTMPEDLGSFAEEVYEFCPDIVDQGTETVQALVESIKETRMLFLWWD